MSDLAPSFPLNQALLAGPLARLLRPLVRLLLRAGVTFPQYAELVRALYVDVATHEILTDPRARTDSRLSLLTGVHRKELRRLRDASELGAPAAGEPPSLTRNSQLIARWLGAPLLRDDQGRPRRLPRLPQPDDAPSWDQLVRSVTTDLRPRAVLEEWKRQGLVVHDADDCISLRDAAFIPAVGQDALLFFFGRNLHDHLAAAAANIARTGATAPFFDRSVHYDGLSAASVAVLEAASRAGAQRLLEQINARALLLSQAEADSAPPPGSATWRINFGAYVFVADESLAAGSAA